MDAKDITGLVLAGGRGLRMGGADKGLQGFQGVPLALLALNRLRAGGGVGPLVINANRHLTDYEALGVPVWPDADTNYAGPLAGFLTGLARCQTPYLLTVPCDVPLFPMDLAQRLATALDTESADLAIAITPQPDGHGWMPFRSQPVFCLMRVSLLPSLRQFIQSGKHKVQDWCDQHATALACFNQATDNPQAFININTLSELHQLEIQTL